MSNKRMALAILGVALLGALAGGVAVAQSSDDADAPITGESKARAEKAALAHLGEGRVSATELGDEESFYEVEVTLEGGRQVDVQLDERFRVVGNEGDDEPEDSGDESR